MSVLFSKLTTRSSQFFSLLPILAMVFFCANSSQAQSTPTSIQISGVAVQSSVHRLGVNLGDNGYWDSGQMMKNLIFENPGFEGLKYRVIFHCTAVTANSCTDDNQWNTQPANYWQGGSFLVISGAAAGATGTVLSNTASDVCKSCGPTLTFDRNVNMAEGDYFSASIYIPGSGDTAWWDDTGGGGTITTETTDLSPNTPGKQAMLMSANGAGQYAKLTQGFDTWLGLSFIQLNGAFQITFRAKGVGGNNQLLVTAQRLQGTNPAWVNQTLTLPNTWKDYTLTFSASETGSAAGPVQLAFAAAGGSVELDDVSLTQTNSSASNPTAFRDDVVNAVKQLNPGTIRMMAAGAALGSDIPNQLQAPFARYRSGFNADGTSVPNIAYGIHEFLQLCQTVGADPWITIPTATTPQEMTEFIEYLTGTGGDSWSGLRISRGQTQPWTTVFNKIHIELGNETWNGAFKGESMNYPAYPQWANQVFGAARQTSGFKASKFDLILSGLGDSPGYNSIMMSTSTQHDSFDIAPYLLYSANDEAQSTMFGAMFAEPEIFDSPGGEVYQNAVLGASTPSATGGSTGVSVYETNLGTMIGNITQAELDKLTPSVGAGIAHTNHMLQMMRAGIQYQNAFSLPQYEYRRSDQSLVRLWGLVVDMGTTNRRRPQFLTQALANTVIAGNMLQTIQGGANPTWNQPLSSDGVQLNGAHYLQSFAFLNGQTASAVLFNLSQTTALPVVFSGQNAPTGTVQMSQITSGSITDSNEFSNVVEPTTKTLSGVTAATGLSLPPFSMTVLTWSSSFVQAPQYSVAPGTYSTTQTVSLWSITSGATIYYTTDGSTPTMASALYNGPIKVSKSQTINAIAVAANLTASPVTQAVYVIQPVAAAPVFSLASGTYNAGQAVTITDAVAGSTIYYTTDGSTPTTASNVYAGAISVTTNETVSAIAAAPNYTNSEVTTAVYTIAPPTTAPTLSVAAGVYQKTQYVQVADTQSGATVYCTTDGTTPTKSSTLCSSGVTVTTTETVKAVAYAPGYSVSPVTSATYTIAPYAAMPVLSVPGGTYNTPQSVTITDSTQGAKIYYTTDQTTPTTSSTVYSSPVSITGVSYLQAIVVAPGYTQSFASTANYVMTVGTPTFTTVGGLMVISDVTPGAALFYTTDGSTPTSASTQYLVPIAITASKTVKAIGIKRNYVNSAIGSGALSSTTGAPTAATPVFTVASGTYTVAQAVSITDTTSGAKIYYTTDGTAPTSSSTIYSGPITVSATETLEAIATASGYTNSAVASATYTISTTTSGPAGTNVISLPNGFGSKSTTMNGSTAVVATALQLTNGGTGQAGTAWYPTKVSINGFTSDFDFQLPISAADGFTFTIHNAKKNVNALGGNTSGLGYQFIDNSVAVAFGLYQSGVSNAESVGIYTGGVSPQGSSINLSGTGINLHSGDVFHATITYKGDSMAVTLTDKKTGAVVTETFSVNIPSNVGGSTAYVGFTGATGGQTAIQNILNWAYSNQ